MRLRVSVLRYLLASQTVSDVTTLCSNLPPRISLHLGYI